MVAAAIVITLGVGTTGFVVIAGYPVFDAFYMALTTMTTVGYMEVHPLAFAGRVFNSCYVFLSVCTLLLTMGIMTQGIIEAQLGSLLERRRMRKMIDQLSGHFIVCGFGRVGRGAAQELRAAGVGMLIVDKREDRVEWAMRNGYLAVLGDSTRDETLKEAGVERAAGLIAALATDGRQPVRRHLGQDAQSQNPRGLRAPPRKRPNARCGRSGPTRSSPPTP